MTLTVDLPDSVLETLQSEAARRGVGVDVVIAGLAETLSGHAGGGVRRRPAFVAVGASEHGLTDRADEILAEGFGRD